MAHRRDPGSRPGERHVWAISLVVSVVFHTLVLLLPIELDQPDRRKRGWSPRARATTTDPLEIVKLPSPTAAWSAPNSQSPVPSIVADTIVPRSPEPSTGVDDEAVPASINPAGSTAPEPADDQPARRFGPSSVDPRLWGLASLSVAPSGYGSLGEAIAAFNREMAGVHVPPGGDMNVWTARDDEDDRWGFSPGAIHLGSVTLPLCSGTFDAANCGFGVSPMFREAYRSRLRQRLEIAGQVQRGEILDRAQAIRARRDAERDSIRRNRRQEPGSRPRSL